MSQNVGDNIAHITKCDSGYFINGISYELNPYENIQEGFSIIPYKNCNFYIDKNEYSGTISSVILDGENNLISSVSDVIDYTKNGSYCNVAYIEPINYNIDGYNIYTIVELVYIQNILIDIQEDKIIGLDSDRTFGVDMQSVCGCITHVLYDSNLLPVAIISCDENGFKRV